MTEYIIAPHDCGGNRGRDHVWDYETRESPRIIIGDRELTFSPVVCMECKKKGMYLYQRKAPYTSIFYVEKPT